jgi:hypothetical protein
VPWKHSRLLILWLNVQILGEKNGQKVFCQDYFERKMVSPSMFLPIWRSPKKKLIKIIKTDYFNYFPTVQLSVNTGLIESHLVMILKPFILTSFNPVKIVSLK